MQALGAGLRMMEDWVRVTRHYDETNDAQKAKATSVFLKQVVNFLVHFDQKIVKIESYRALIDSNTNTIQDVISHTEETIKDLRENFEKEKMKTLKETKRID